LPSQGRLELVPSPSSVGRARAFVAELLDLWDCDDPDAVAVLLTSEIVTNAVRHAATPVVLDVSLQSDAVLLVEASDTHPGMPRVLVPEPDDDQGRGMFLVDQLAWRHGVRPRPSGGKTVWFEVRVFRRAPGT
jgi:anti-sigma regulatory factor (Ser/Thr protein kinase)